jgi:hypothetical protein
MFEPPRTRLALKKVVAAPGGGCDDATELGLEGVDQGSELLGINLSVVESKNSRVVHRSSIRTLVRNSN